jgi:hypothetical protein
MYLSSLGYTAKPKIVIVEGTTDVALFQSAAAMEYSHSGVQLLGDEMCIVAPGDGDLGGTRGVHQALICIKGLIPCCLLPNGKPKYRVIALFDNDNAGKWAIQTLRSVNAAFLEAKDLFRLMPVMKAAANLDPSALKKQIETDNAPYKSLDWEIEDLLSETLIDGFLAERNRAVRNTSVVNGKRHRDYTADGKAQLHRFVRINAIRDDLLEVVRVLTVLRSYFGLL